MKVPGSEDRASYAGPESCVGHREVRREALTGEPVGQPLSRESFIKQGADARAGDSWGDLVRPLS